MKTFEQLQKTASEWDAPDFGSYLRRNDVVRLGRSDALEQSIKTSTDGLMGILASYPEERSLDMMTRLQVDTLLSGIFGKSLPEVERDRNFYMQAVTGNNLDDKSFLTAFSNSFTSWSRQKEISRMQNRYDAMPDSPAREQLRIRIDDMLMKEAAQRDFTDRRWFGRNMVRSAPVFAQGMETMAVALGTGMIGSLLAPAAIGSMPMLAQSVSSAGVALRAAGSVGGFGIGSALGTAWYGSHDMFETIRGQTSLEMMNELDSEGNPIPDDIRSVMATGSAFVETAFEYMINFPFLDRIFKGARITPSELFRISYANLFKEGFKGWGIGMIGESGTEGIEEFSDGLFMEAAKVLSNRLAGTRFAVGANELGQVFKDAGKEFKESLFPMGVMGAVGLGVDLAQPMMVTSSMKSDAHKYFKRDGQTIDARYVNTQGTKPGFSPVQGNEGLSIEKLDPIEVVVHPITGELRVPDAGQRQTVANLQAQGISAIQGKVVNLNVVEGGDPSIVHTIALSTGAEVSGDDTVVFSDADEVNKAVFTFGKGAFDVSRQEAGYVLTFQDSDGAFRKIHFIDSKTAGTAGLDTVAADESYFSETYVPYSGATMTADRYVSDSERKMIEGWLNESVGRKISRKNLRPGVEAMLILSRATGITTDELIGRKIRLQFATEAEVSQAIQQSRKKLSPEDVNGWRSVEDAGGNTVYTIHLSKNANPSTIVHETGHVLRALATDAQLQAFADAYGGTAYGMWLTDIKEGDGKFYLGDRAFDTREEAEAVATANEERFADDFVRYLKTGTAPNTEMQGLFARMKEFLKDVYNAFKDSLTLEVRKAFDDLLNSGMSQERTAAGALFQSDDSVMSRVRQEYEETEKRLRDNPSNFDADGNHLAPNGKPSNLTYEQWVQVRTPAFKKWFGDWEPAENYKWLMTEAPIVELSGEEFKEKLVDDVEAFYKLRGNSVIREGLGVVTLARHDIQTSVAHGIGRNKAIAFAAVPDVIQQGKEFNRVEDYKGRGYTSITIAAPIAIKNQEYICEVVINQRPSSNNFYLHEVEIKEKLQFGNQVRSYMDEKHPNRNTKTGASRLIISKLLAEGKFNASKVVDENGEPKIMYHGSPSAGFDTFEIERSGSSNSNAPIGFWFAEDRALADVFSQMWWGRTPGVYDVFLNMKNPKEYVTKDMSDEANRLKGEIDNIQTQKNTILKELTGNEPNNFFVGTSESRLYQVAKADFLYYGKPFGEKLKQWDALEKQQKQLYEQLNVADDGDAYLQMLDDLDEFATYNGEKHKWGREHRAKDDSQKAIAQYKQSLMDQGYDGIVIRNTDADARSIGRESVNQYVVFSPNQIKSATDNRGTFDGENPNILFQMANEKNGAVYARNNADAITELKKHQGIDIVNKYDGAVVQFGERGRSKMLSNKARSKSVKNGFSNEEHNTAVANVPHIFENAIRIAEHPDTKGGNKDVTIFYYAAAIRFSGNGKDGYAKLLVKRTENVGNRIYTVELIGLEKIESSRLDGELSEEERRALDSVITLPSVPSVVNNDPNILFQTSLESNPAKKAVYERTVSAIRDIVGGQESAVIQNARHDISEYGGSNDIELIWGDRKKGLYHIGYRRGKDVVFNVIRTLLDGKISKFVEPKKTLHIEWNGYEAVLSLNKDGENATWLLTGWKQNEPDAVSEVGTQSDATHIGPTFSRSDMGAGITYMIEQMGGSVNEESSAPLFQLSDSKRQEYQELSDKFDADVDALIAGSLPENHVLVLGKPGPILSRTGFPEGQNIELSASHLRFKARIHDFVIEDVKGLVMALLEPVAVFRYGDGAKAQNVIVDIRKGDKNFLVGMHFNQERRGTVVSDIRGLFPKETSGWLNWISQGKLLYADKMKLQEAIAQQQTNSAEVGGSPEPSDAGTRNPQQQTNSAEVGYLNLSSVHRILDGTLDVNGFARNSSRADDTPLFQLSEEKRQEYLDARKRDVKEAVGNHFYVGDGILSEYAGEEWADREIRFRQASNFTGSLDEARQYAEREQYLDAMREQSGEEHWNEEEEEWYKRVWDYSRIRTPQQSDRIFLQQWAGSEKSLLALAARLKGYSDVSTRNGKQSVAYRFASFKDVDRRVTSLSMNSSDEQIRKAMGLVYENPRAYRKALQTMEQADARVMELKGLAASGEAYRDAYYDALGEAMEDELAMFDDPKPQDHDEGIAKVRLSERQRMASLEEQERRLLEANAELKALNVKVSEKLKASQSQLKDWEKRLTEATASRDTKQKQLDELREETRTAKRERDALRSQLSKSIQLADRSTAINESLHQEGVILRRENGKLQTRIKHLDERLQDDRHRQRLLKEDLAAAEKELDRVRRVKDSLQRRLWALTIKNEKARLVGQIKKKSSFNNDTMDASYEDAFRFVSSLFAKDGRSIVAMPEALDRYMPEEYLGMIQRDNRISRWTIAELEALHDALLLMRTDARLMKQRRDAERSSYRQSIAIDVFKQNYGRMPAVDVRALNTTGIMNDITEDINTSRQKYHMGDEGPVMEVRHMVSQSFVHLDRLARWLDGQKEGPLYNFFVRKVWEGYTAEDTEIQRRLEGLEAVRKELGLTAAYLGETVATYKAGGKTDVSLTREQAIGVYVYSRNDKGRKKLLGTAGNGMNEFDIADVVGKLSDKDKAFGDFLIVSIGGDSEYTRLKEAAYRAYNVNLAKEENYFPLRSVGIEIEGTQDLSKGPQRTSTSYVEKGMTQDRVDVTYPLDLDVVNTWMVSMKQQEHLIAFAEWVQDAQYLLGPKGAVGHTISVNYGQTSLRTLNEFVNKIAGQNEKLSNLEKMFNHLLSRAAASKISASLSSMMKQAASLSAGLRGDIDPLILMRMLFGFSPAPDVHGWKDARRIMFELDPEMKKRTFNLEIERYRNLEHTSKVGEVVSKVTDLGIEYGTEAIDAKITTRMWWGVYLTQLKKGVASGEAVFRASRFVSETQSSSNLMDLSLTQLSKNPFMRALAQFKNDNFQHWNQLCYDLPYYVRNKMWREAGGTLTCLALGSVLLIAFGGGLLRVAGEDDDEKKRRIVASLIAQVLADHIPIIGDGIVAGMRGFGGDGLVSIDADFGRLLGEVVDSDGNNEALARRIWDFIESGASVVGLPTLAAGRIVRSVDEDNWWRLLGGYWYRMGED